MSGEVDLVLLDVGLPTMDGFEVLRELRARGSAIPVIMLTARSSTRDTVEGLDSGRERLRAEAVHVRRAARPHALAAARDAAVVGRVGRRRVTSCSTSWPGARPSTDARSICPRASSRSPSSSCATPDRCSAASCCSAASGAWTSIRDRTSSTCTSATCAASSAPITSSTVAGRRLPLGVTHGRHEEAPGAGGHRGL